MALWKRGFVEAINPPATPYHVLAQQLLALTFQEGRIGIRLWRDWIGWMPAFKTMDDGETDSIVSHLVEQGSSRR